MYCIPAIVIILVTFLLPLLKIRDRNVLVLLTFILSACVVDPTNSTTSINCDEPATAAFYIVNHGLHTGIAVKRADLTAIVTNLADDLMTGEYVEVGWGDERFYQAPAATAGLAVRAMLWPTASVLHVVSIPEQPAVYFPGNEILEITVPFSGYQRMLVYIAETFSLATDNRITRLGPGLYGKSHFYAANGSFHAFNTCNTWVARAIANTGYPLSADGIIRSERLMTRLREGKNTGMKCFSVH